MKTPAILLVSLIFLGAFANSHAQPVITQQPQNQTNLAGATVTLSVEAAGTPLLNYQWRSYTDTTSFSDIAGATGPALSVTNIQPTSQSFGVVVSDTSGSVTSKLVRIFVAPTITQQPSAQILPDGSRTSFSVQAVSSAALRYQWFFNGTPLTGQRGTSLELFRVESDQAGDYTVVITNQFGGATSEVARLTVTAEPGLFTRVSQGAIVNDLSTTRGCAWGDYDDDGFIDLVVANASLGATNNFLYHNNRDGTFTRVTNSPVELGVGSSRGVAWGDYDNDGNLDLVTVQVLGTDPSGRTVSGTNHLFRGAGNGMFVDVTNDVMRLDKGGCRSVSWVDFDNDGFLDVFRTMGEDAFNRLYHNKRDGTFSRVTQGRIVTDQNTGAVALGAAWGDYNDDGRPDLFVAEAYIPSRLYCNEGDGTFSRISAPGLGGPGPNHAWVNGDWGDYDNDGDLDLFISAESGVNTNGWPNVFLRNDGLNGFTTITNLPAKDPESNGGASWGCKWADYDNDGWLDLLVANANVTHNNFLYHNNGDGTFTKIASGSIAHDGATCWSAAWGDYDNDGFLDLFVGTGFDQLEKNLLYHNNGNANHWIKFRLIGTRSNRSAIGAKVRVRATINGRDLWQMREVSGGGYLGQNDMRPNFGLGDATSAGTVRIEWPSGTVQELHDLAANQILTVTEPALLEPTLTLANGVVELKVNSWPGFTCEIQASSDLKNWTSLGSVTNATDRVQLPDAGAQNVAQRFYRAVQR